MSRIIASLLLACVLLMAISGPACSRSRADREDQAFPRIPIHWTLNLGADRPDVVRATNSQIPGCDLILQQDARIPPVEGQSAWYGLLPRGCENQPLKLSEAADLAPAFSFREQEFGRLVLFEGSNPVFAYNFAPQLPQGVPEDRRRSSYFHPVYNLAGRPLTDDFPQDHYHHRGLSWMWPRVTVEGETRDLWHLKGVEQVFQNWLAQRAGPVCATLGIRNRWQIEKKPIMEEEIWVRTYRSDPVGRAIDISITWLPSTDIRLAGEPNKGYGGLCFRLAPRRDVSIHSARGREGQDSDLVKLPWADQSGKFGPSDDVSGISIFQHSANPDFPAGWCLRHYGFLGVSWPGKEPFEMEAGSPLNLRFRLWIHKGDTEMGRVSQAFEDYQNPPMAPDSFDF